MKLTMPDGRTWNTDGYMEPSLKDVYQKKLMDYYNTHAGVQPLPEFRIAIRAIKQEYADLTGATK